MDHFLDSVLSYVIAFVLMFASHVNELVQWGGLILLVVRLIADAPRALEAIKGWRSGG
jgi:hypothetical protein